MAIISIPTSIGGISIPGKLTDLIGGPLADLYRYGGLEYVKYPRNLESSTRSHVVKFTINEINEVKLEDAVNSAATGINKLTSSFGGTVGGLRNISPKDITDSVKSSVTSFGNFSQNVSETGKKFNEVKKEFTTQKTTPIGIIALYMPETMNFTYTPEYDNSVTLASAAGALPLIGGIASKMTNILEGNDAARLALNKAGYVFNPNKQLLFRGIDFRTFQMSFTFTPYSRNESDDVKKIIKMFRSYAAPTIVEEGGGMFFKPPAIFDIEFLFNGSDNKNIPRLEKSVITNVDVNYAPNGWSTHNDGAPVQTIVTLDFQEMILIDKKKIDEGF
jgi:hypothetical protein